MLELLLLALTCLGGSGFATALLLYLTRQRLRFLRALPLLAALILWMLAWKEYQTPSMFGGLNTLSALGKAAGGVLILIGWAVPMMFCFWKGRKP